MDTPKHGDESMRRDEAFVISQLKQQYGIEGSSKYDPIFDKLAKGVPITDEEREDLRMLQKPRKPKTTTTLDAPSIKEPREITMDITATMEKIRSTLRGKGTKAGETTIPSLGDQPGQSYEELKAEAKKLLGIEHSTDSVFEEVFKKFYRQNILKEKGVTYTPVEEATREWLVAEFKKIPAASGEQGELQQNKSSAKSVETPPKNLFARFIDLLQGKK